MGGGGTDTRCGRARRSDAGHGGIEAARRLLERSPGTRVVFLSMQQSPAIAREALSTGALGYVFKASANEGFGRAICAALDGQSFVSSFD